MSMGDLPPRQKMINVMYLVLLALLAMNVSKEILNSFVIINEGLEKTNDAFKSKNAYTYSLFDKAKINDPEKVTPYWKAANEVRALAEELDVYIRELKAKLIAGVEQIPEEVADTISLWKVQSKDQYDMPTTLLIGPDQTNPRDGDFSALDLKQHIEYFNKSVIEKLPADMVNSIDVKIDLNEVPEGDKMVSWEIGNFYHAPLASIITNLSRLQAEVRNVEADVIKQLYSKIGADDFSFDALKIAVRPTKGTYITVGDSFKAEVLIAAYSTTQDPVLEIGNAYNEDSTSIVEPDMSKVIVKNGIATYWDIPRTPGEYEWGGILKVKKPNGEITSYKFRNTFTAAKPNLVISPTKMNVFYRGLENPIAVSVPGVPSDKLQVTCSNATLKKTGSGEFEIMPGSGPECEIRVTAEMNGAKQSFPPQIFRVKRVPPPTPEFLGKRGSFKMPKGSAASAQFLVAKLDDFLFDLKYIVTSFKMSVTVGGKVGEYTSNSNQITPEMKGIISKMSPGQMVVFKEIKAKMVPNGKPENLDGNIILEIQ